MKTLPEFQIDIFSLSNKLHQFEFEISDRLFTLHEQSLVRKGRGKCILNLQKSETMMTLQFSIHAEVELTCDRSLETFWHPIETEEEIIIKFGESNYTLSEDVLVIRNDTPSLNVGEFIYEFINLAVPMKKLHPKYAEEEDEMPDLIYSTKGEDQEEKNEDSIDPRWEALKKLKGNK